MLLAFLHAFALFARTDGLLFPQVNEQRQLYELDGLWWFVREPLNSNGIGFANSWFNREISHFDNASKIPVPCAYNDLTQDIAQRDHVGWVWYQREFFISSDWQKRRAVVRFSSVHYFASVFINGQNVVNHTSGHLPFEADINAFVSFTGPNRITVAVNNTLSHSTIPQGEFTYKPANSHYTSGDFDHVPDFDFFNYAGILRPVYLYATNNVYIKDMLVITTTDGTVNYTVTTTGVAEGGVQTRVRLLDDKKTMIAAKNASDGTLVVTNPQLWWPIGMDQKPGYLYTFEVTLYVNGQSIDIYRLPIGIREVKVSNGLLINGKPFYCTGFGMHEDSEIRGRGFDRAIMVKDLNMVEWFGGNCYRTSHYPYSEERQYEADRRGIAVFAETPAVGIRVFDNANLMLHQQLLTALIERDRNHPGVIVWSISNEPQSNQPSSRTYFQKFSTISTFKLILFRSLINLAHQLDNTRPVTIVMATDYNNDQAADFVDIICINRYYGWYSDMGHLERTRASMNFDLAQWHNKYKKPIIVTEYGAEAIPGINHDPGMDFSITYQVELLRQTHLAFDDNRALGYLAGEMVWNFADFMTAQSTSRAGGNHKGMLTRNRQPKMAAYVLKQRYESLKVNNTQAPPNYCVPRNHGEKSNELAIGLVCGILLLHYI